MEGKGEVMGKQTHTVTNTYTSSHMHIGHTHTQAGIWCDILSEALPVDQMVDCSKFKLYL